MKTSNHSINYSLYNVLNYKKKLEHDTTVILDKFLKIMIEYLKYVLDNMNLKNNNYSKFIIIRGVETIYHVFHFILYYTNNLDITYFHTQKAVYFYVEFIQQTSTDENSFLQLSSRDATMYVYRKTIFEINNDCRKNLNNSSLNKEVNEKWDCINKVTSCMKFILNNLLNNSEFYDIKNNGNRKYIILYEKIASQITELSILSVKEFNIIDLFVNKLNIDRLGLNNYTKILEQFFLKIKSKLKNLSIIQEKIYETDEQFNNYEKLNLFISVN